MTTPTRALAAVLLPLLASCTQVPTAASETGDVSFTGLGLGSGHRAQSETTAAPPPATADHDDAGDDPHRSGFGFGSGH